MINVTDKNGTGYDTDNVTNVNLANALKCLVSVKGLEPHSKFEPCTYPLYRSH